MARIKRGIQLMKTFFFYRYIFKKIGNRSIVQSAMKIENGKNIIIGNNVIIGYKAWLAASPLTGTSTCQLEIQDGSSIGNFSHIYATQSILIEKNVLIADKVYISDNLHGYKDISIPIIKQNIIQKNIVVIKEGAWIGENACVLGVTVGKNSVVGSNSVVTKDVPDFCIAAGVPAKIIKRYCFDKLEWRKTDSKGEFI